MSLVIHQGLFLLEIADHYAILGLPIGTESKLVRKAYLKIAQRLHPDTCKARDAAEKKLASEMLSKLVNPAYEQLSKQNSWSEYQVILRQLSKQLNQNRDTELRLKSAIAQELYAMSSDLKEAYPKKVAELAQDNYTNIATTLETIGAISELNLVYLKASVQANANLLSRSTATSRPTESTPPPTNPTKPTVQTKQTAPPPPPASATKTTTSSSLDAAIWRGEEHLKKKNYAKATLEFRDAIKLDPNCVKAHALMGISYLQQNQISMAKVHVKKAYMAKPSDPLARQAKEALEKAMGSALDTRIDTKNNPPDKKGGLFGGLFGGKKK